MAEDSQLQWSDEQWNQVRQVVYEEARGARVAGNVLPLFGPLDPDARFVAKEVLNNPEKIEDGVPGFTVGDSTTLRLSTLQVKVYLKGSQVADPQLTSALIAFRRAANVLSRLEDAIVFCGQKEPGSGPEDWPAAKPKESGPSQWEVLGGEETPGLLATAGLVARKPEYNDPIGVKGTAPNNGDDLVSAVSDAIGKLEAQYHLGPFACILDQKYFNTAQTPPPNMGMVLPSDRILPFLGGGSILRSSVLPDCSGLVIALGGAPIDLVVASDITVNFLQVTTDPWFVFRVKEKIVLRINQPRAVVGLNSTGTRGGK